MQEFYANKRAAEARSGIMREAECKLGTGRHRHFGILFLNAIGKLFDHGVGEHFAGDPLDLSPRRINCESVRQSQCKVFALAHGSYGRKSDLAQSVLDGLALRIEDRSFQRDIDMGLHYQGL